MTDDASKRPAGHHLNPMQKGFEMHYDSSGGGVGPRLIPKALKNEARWIPWTQELNPAGKPTKRPAGSTRDPRNYREWHEVAGLPNTPTRGIGIVMTGRIIRKKDGATLIAFDLDACRCPKTGRVSPWADTHLLRFNRSYTEVTPSGAGFRQWVWIVDAPDAVPKIDIPIPAPAGVDKNAEIQTFGCGAASYVTVTGDHVVGSTVEPLTFPNLDVYLDAWGITAADLDKKAKKLKPRGDVTPETAREMLKHIPEFDDREMWVKVGMGICDEFGDELGFDLWDEWAQQSGKHDALDSERVWESIGEGDVTYASIGYHAREGGGYQPNGMATDDFDAESWEPPASAKAKPVEREALTQQVGDAAEGRDDQTFLVYGVVPGHGIGQIIGESGSGKTPWVLSLALHTALGLATFQGDDLENPGKVAYLIGEDRNGVLNRFEAQLKTLDPTMSLKEVADLHVSTRAARLVEEADVKLWAGWLKAKFGKLSLIVIDTTNGNFGPGDENSTEDATKFVAALNLLADELQCFVLAVHHSGHSNKDRGRGSSVIYAAVDFEARIKRELTTLSIKSTKSKNCAPFADKVAHLTPVVIRQDRKGRDITAITLDNEPPTPLARDVRVDAELEDVVEFLRGTDGHTVSYPDIAAATGLTTKVARTRTDRAVDLGIVTAVGDPGKARSYVVNPAAKTESEELLS